MAGSGSGRSPEATEGAEDVDAQGFTLAGGRSGHCRTTEHRARIFALRFGLRRGRFPVLPWGNLLMDPGRFALSRIIYRAADRLAVELDRPEWQVLAEAIKACAHELAQRELPDFYQAFTRRGAELAAEGEALQIRLGAGTRATDLHQAQHLREPSTPTPAIEQDILAILGAVERSVHALAECHEEAVLAYFRAVGAWENSLYAHRIEPLDDFSPATSIRFDPDRFVAYLRERIPEASDLAIASWRQLPGGFSKTTILLDTVSTSRGREGLVIRIEPANRFMELDGHDIRNEFPVVRYAYGVGLPVAEPLWLEDNRAIIGERFFISRQMPGRILGTVINASEAISPTAIRKMAATLAAIHAVRPSPSDPLIAQSHVGRWAATRSMAENTSLFVDYWRGQLERNDTQPSPLVTRGLDWLSGNVPQDDAPLALLHGDFGLHNLLIEDDEVTAVLDWENSRVGDPAEELAALLSGTEGALDKAQFLRDYQAAGGRPVGEYRLAYFTVYNCIFGAIGGLATLSRIRLSQANPSWAIFGLRFMQHYAARLENAIAAAERIKAGEALGE